MIHVSARHRVVGVPVRPDLDVLFPNAPKVTWAGNNLIVVPHSFMETKLLRERGFDVPAPVLTQYQWPYPAGEPPFDVQKRTVAMLTTNQRAYNLNGMGCVDADTEYLSPTGWVRISEYVGGEVAQYHPDTGTISFVKPTEYVKLPCAEMIRFKTTRGVDQLLSPEHRVLLADGRVLQAWEIEACYGTRASKGFRFRTTFGVTGTTGVPLTHEQIRVQVAVNADGYKRVDMTKVIVRLKKQRKINRLRALLDAAKIPFKVVPCAPNGFVRFTFVPPMAKGFGAAWWVATQDQLEVIASEAAYWDGTHRKAAGISFSSYTKADADFVQYAYSAAGQRASLNVNTRNRHGHTEHEYCVYAKSGNPNVGLFGASNGIVRRNVIREPSTDGFKYCFMVPTTFLLLRRNGCIFATGNTGKTRCALWAYDFLRSIGQAKRALIVAPLSTLSFTWQREAFRCFPHLSSTVLVGKRDKRLKLLGEDHHLFVINPDGLKVIGPELLARLDIDTLIIDELAVFRNAKGEKNKYLRGLTKRMVWAWGMTGSPTPNEPTDAYGQCMILTPHTVPQRFTHFREAVMLRESQFRWIPKKEAKDHVFSVMQPAVRFTLDDVVELPPFIERQVDIDLGAKQKEVYTALKNHAYVLHQQQEITAANAGAVLNKLLQISLGYVYSKGKDDTERRVTSLDNTDRLDRLVDDINACDQKVIVFAPFDHAIDGIVARLREEKIEAAVVKGGVQSKVRNQIFAAFQQTQKYRVIVAHPGTMAHGVTLTAASCIIWFGPTTSLETFEQANARIRRVGQRAKQLFLMYQSTPAERRMYARLRAKQRVQDGVLELFANAQL